MTKYSDVREFRFLRRGDKFTFVGSDIVFTYRGAGCYESFDGQVRGELRHGSRLGVIITEPSPVVRMNCWKRPKDIIAPTMTR